MSRYTVKHTGPNWYSMVDKATGKTVLETTRAGMEIYSKIFCAEMPKEVK